MCTLGGKIIDWTRTPTPDSDPYMQASFLGAEQLMSAPLLALPSHRQLLSRAPVCAQLFQCRWLQLGTVVGDIWVKAQLLKWALGLLCTVWLEQQRVLSTPENKSCHSVTKQGFQAIRKSTFVGFAQCLYDWTPTTDCESFPLILAEAGFIWSLLLVLSST